ncbi:hypothetical protein Glove_35g26 [Diversispora epigaea]|uniref:Reverse transcriptase RNase H-like domain-containing protein n=1 Tax=Diversispora epigaea TaxID=1348612 RepID=A0A397JN63_9GLOM|nr:hypothetical protein Glove_35g26 [Diversispora epigaea]
MERLTEVFNKLKIARLKLKPNKCYFIKKELKFLEYVVNEKLIISPILTYLNFKKHEKEKVVIYANKSLIEIQKNYSATELEILAVVWAVK